MIGIYSLWAITIFLSSFLLFQVQPLISKHILSWYGGGSAVWMVAMFFFMVVLALGYLYALGLSFFNRFFQILVHGVLIASVFLIMFRHSSQWPSAITPLHEYVGTWSSDTAMSVLFVLSLSVGLPFFLLSTTSSLLQSWYGTLSGKEPFSLYSLSNVGSLLGLLSYPLVFEPFLSTPTQGKWWSYGLVCYGLLLGIIVIVYAWRSEPANRITMTQTRPLPSAGQFWRWVFLAAIPVAAMVTGTRQLTTDVAPLPLLWVLPISLYLVSFIVSFQNRSFLKPLTVQWLMLSACLLGLLPLGLTFIPSVPSVVLVLAALFAVCHYCHELLYRERPVAAQSTLYYVALSIGGIVGSLSMLVSSLFLLVVPIEFALIVLVVGALISYQIFIRYPDRLTGFLRYNRVYFFSICLAGLLFFTGGALLKNMHKSIFQARNFFGHKSVTEYETKEGRVRTLIHGLTNHGFEVLDGKFAGGSASYYGPGSGVGKSIEALRAARGNTPLRVAVIGMGGGVLAAYCRPGDQFSFFEIDPQVVDIAKHFFHYLDRCPDRSIVVEDGRIGMERARREGVVPYDIVVIDAYADDTVPAHLLTLEAANLYKQLLVHDGLLALHISSRHLDLRRVAASYREIGLSGLSVSEKDPPFPYFESQWVVLANEQAVLDRLILSGVTVLTLDAVSPVPWTDTTSSLLPLIRY